MEEKRLQRLGQVAAVACALAFAAHLLVVRRFAVDVPFWDEWELLREDGLGQGVRLAWLLQQANEHRLPLTRLQVALHLRLDGWNLVNVVTVNFLLWGGVALAAGALLARRGGLLLAAPFALFLLSTLGHENHAWGYQSQFHFALLGALGAALALERPEAGWRSAAPAALGVLLATCGMTAGLILSAALLGAAGAHGLHEASRAAPEERRRRLGWLAAVVVPWAALAATWAAHRQPAQFPYASPASSECWAYFLNLVALGFGVTTPSAAVGLLALCAVLAGAGLSLRAARPGPERRAAAVVAGLTAGVLLCLFAVAVGRATAFPSQVKASKYWTVAGLLVPLCAAAWHQALAARPRVRRGALVGLWCVVALAYADDWGLDGYRLGQRRREDGLRCVASYYATGAPRACPELYYRELAPRLDQARALGLSFTRRAGPR